LALPVAEAFPCRKSKKSLDNPGSRLLISTAAGTEETPALFLQLLPLVGILHSEFLYQLFGSFINPRFKQV